MIGLDGEKYNVQKSTLFRKKNFLFEKEIFDVFEAFENTGKINWLLKTWRWRENGDVKIALIRLFAVNWHEMRFWENCQNLCKKSTRIFNLNNNTLENSSICYNSQIKKYFCSILYRKRELREFLIRRLATFSWSFMHKLMLWFFLQ